MKKDETMLERVTFYNVIYHYLRRLYGDRDLPCYTFVLYMGDKPWTKRIVREDKFPLGIESMKEYVDIYWVMEDIDSDKFHEKDIGDHMKGIKMINLTKDGGDEAVRELVERLNAMDMKDYVLEGVLRITNCMGLLEELIKLKGKRGEGNVCVALDAFEERKINEGRIIGRSEGKAEGITEGSAIKAYKTVEHFMKRTSYKLNKALHILGISKKEYNQGKRLLNEKKHHT